MLISYALLYNLTIGLGFITISVVLLAVGKRFINSWETTLRTDRQEEILSLVFRYVEGEASKEEITSYLDGSWSTARAFQEIVYELIEDLEGSYKDRLQDLLKIDLLYNTYQTYLGTFSEHKKLDALDYFRHLHALPDDIVDKLWKYIDRGSLILAHASTSALMRATDVMVRRKAIKKYIQRSDATLHSFMEILHEYHRPELEQTAKESKLVPSLLFRDDLKANVKIALLRCVPQFGYLEQADTLHCYLIILNQEQGKPNVIAECIRALGRLYYVTAAPLIRELAVESPHSGIRQACAFALGKFGTEKDHREIVPLLLDSNYDVQYEAAQALSKAGGEVDELLAYLAYNKTISAENIFYGVKKESQEVQSHLFRIS
ncbi:HEAT repeat domain-containing protein [Fodinibius sp. AD559]|uniref:HEAT repeat domain-containing protein n=1 Tax=Fodinibius sp. AD559 TaxID=3424179 RepID=UPI004046BFE7